MRRILIVNRWNDDFADYGAYIDHSAPTAYVTTPVHARMVPPGTAHVETVDDPDDVEAIIAAARRCAAEVGPFDVVMALSEFDLLTGARVREALGAPGRGLDATLLFRDKTRMKQAMHAAGVRAPAYRAVRTLAEIDAFWAEHPGKLVVKPRAAAASEGVFVFDTGDDHAAALAGVDLTDYEAEEFLEGPIWHVDGLVQRGKPVFHTTSRYIGTCHGFSLGRPLGSVVQTGEQAARVADFAFGCLSVLGLDDGAFHLEVIEQPDGPAFLEVGARVGGGEIPFVSRDVYGVDLIGDWIRVELGEPPRTLPASEPTEIAGFLMLPEPVGSRLVSRESMVGGVRGLYAEDLPEPGHVFDGKGGYETILARFRFRGPTSQAVTESITATLARFHYTLERPV
ncbi:ATP-grasp domain-containing protein [Saccharothrix isguenensis]